MSLFEAKLDSLATLATLACETLALAAPVASAVTPGYGDKSSSALVWLLAASLTVPVKLSNNTAGCSGSSAPQLSSYGHDMVRRKLSELGDSLRLYPALRNLLTDGLSEGCRARPVLSATMDEHTLSPVSHELPRPLEFTSSAQTCGGRSPSAGNSREPRAQ